jgi:hypothetical protein
MSTKRFDISAPTNEKVLQKTHGTNLVVFVSNLLFLLFLKIGNWWCKAYKFTTFAAF